MGVHAFTVCVLVRTNASFAVKWQHGTVGDPHISVMTAIRSRKKGSISTGNQSINFQK